MYPDRVADPAYRHDELSIPDNTFRSLTDAVNVVTYQVPGFLRIAFVSLNVPDQFL